MSKQKTVFMSWRTATGLSLAEQIPARKFVATVARLRAEGCTHIMREFPVPAGSVMLAVPEWQENRFGRHTARFVGMTLEVFWDRRLKGRRPEEGFAWQFGDVRSSQVYGNVDEAKKMAVEFARRRLQNALLALEMLEELDAAAD